MRIIDADALIHELNNSHYPGAPYIDAGISIAIGKVCDAPTIEARNEALKWCIEFIDNQTTIEPDRDAIWDALSKVYNRKDVPDGVKSIRGDVMLSLDEQEGGD